MLSVEDAEKHSCRRGDTMFDWTGQKLGNYKIMRVLGHGGFADVYLGQQVYLQTYAAIKVLQSRLTDNDLQTFLKEARTVASLAHPHIVRVLEFGEEGHTPYLVMDYCPNNTLRQRHQKGTRVSLFECVSYVKQIAEALQYAHERKIIHRDVKPENMLIGQNNNILLSDFGIATISQSSRYSRRQDIGGTIAYSAPEQLQGKASFASDQYSLAIVLYECLTGKLPYQGSFSEIASQHLVAPVPTIRDVVPSLPIAVEQILQKALAKDPQQRFQNVHDFAIALEQASLGESTLSVVQSGQDDSQTDLSTYIKTQTVTPIDLSSVPTSSISRQTPLLSTSSHPFPYQQTQPVLGNNRNRLFITIIILLVLALGGVSTRAFFFTSARNVQQGNSSPQTVSNEPTNSSPTFVPTPTLTPTLVPTPTFTPTPSPKTLTVKRQLVCTGGLCASTDIQMTVNTFTIDTSLNQTSMMFSLLSAQDCGSAFFSHLNFQDSTGQSYSPGGQVGTFTDFSLAQRQQLNLTATYAFIPTSGSTYTLSTELFCDTANDSYGDAQFTF